MARSKNKCTGCKEFFPKEQMIVTNVGKFHSEECRKNYGLSSSGMKATIDLVRKERLAEERKQRAEKIKTAREEAKELRLRKKEAAPMSYHYDKLQDLINQWITKVRDKDEPCCTCGTRKPNIKYDAGHYRSRGACQELRFELTNIHKQCSVQCNGFKSGARAEYRDFILFRYGQEHLDWLDGPHPMLKDKLPDWQSVEVEIRKFRKLLRDAGLKPCR